MSADPGNSRRRTAALLAILVICASLAISFQAIPFKLDDAFIAFRYAENLAEGHGLRYNEGGPAVEGFTSQIWVLGLAAAGRLLGPEAIPWAATLAGLASLVCVLAILGAGLLRSSSREDPASWLPPLIALSLFAMIPTANNYAVTGLETLLFAAVVAAFASALAGRLPLPAGLAAGVLALWVRPEGAWLLVAGAAQLAACHGGKAWLEMKRRRPALLAGSVVLGGLSLLAFRAALFGTLLPNTFHAKTPSLAEGWSYLLSTFSKPPMIPLLICGLAGAWLGTREHRGYLAAGISWAVAAVLEGGDWMPAGRMLLPSFTLLAMSAGGIGRLPLTLRPASLAGLGLVALTVVFNAGQSWGFAGDTARVQLWGGAERRAMADFMLKSGAGSVGLVDIGATGYYTHLEILDLAGLTDATIARAPGGHLTKEFDLDYVFEERDPDLLLLRFSSLPSLTARGELSSLDAIRPSHAMSPVERRVMSDPRLDQRYDRLFLQIPPPGDVRPLLYARLVFVKRGLALPDAVTRHRGIMIVPVETEAAADRGA